MTQEQALTILKTGANVFLTGEPGSGKTHTINQYVAYLRERDIEPAITASTGIAATHIGGMTIHSWSGMGIKTKLDKYDLDKIASTEYIAKRVLRAKVLIIDEVSMLLSETLSMIDAVCREIKRSPDPFGGLQIILVGDFFQLPPIVNPVRNRTQTQASAISNGVKNEIKENNAQSMLLEESLTRFAYDSPAWNRANPIVCYLTEQYRQDDDKFLSILSAIRTDTFGEDQLCHIETRKIKHSAAPESAPKLFSHNADVDRVNEEILAKLPGKPQAFPMSSRGSDSLVAALKKGCLSPETLYLKVGAAVMFTKNSPKEGFVNGTLGEVKEFNKYRGNPVVKTRDGKLVEVEPMDWAVEENGKVRAKITQLPLRLAWAITVHKSQGMSLDEAVMDLTDVFEFGQGYVALSRVRRLSGLYLLGYNNRAFQVHPSVLGKDLSFRAQSDKAINIFADMSQEDIEQMHKQFIIALGGKFKKSPSTKKTSNKTARVNTHDATLALFQKGKTISDIAKERGFTKGTVLSHLEKLVIRGKISRGELARLLTPALVAALPDILDAFRALDSEKLTPVFEKFKGKYSYDDLRLARMMLKFE